MASNAVSRGYDHLLDFLIEKATPEEILSFELTKAEKDRAIELLDKQDEDDLTPDEAVELEQMRETELLMMALKAKALEATSKK